MTHGSLFSGIGGFELAAECMGWENIFHCEWNPFGQKVLKHYWPKAISYDDITKTDFSIHRGTIDILSGGFPCQPYSLAGLRKGKDDERHLWPHMLRAIRESKPRWVVGENVLGLVGWNGGLVFEEVQADLEAEGYEVQPYILPAASVNAPHRRNRVWFIAYSKSTGGSRLSSGKNSTYSEYGILSNDGIITNTRLQRPKITEKQTTGFKQCGGWKRFPTQSPVCNGDDGISSRLDGITFPTWRNESIKAGGNAIVPHLALQIFKSIEQYEQLNVS